MKMVKQKFLHFKGLGVFKAVVLQPEEANFWSSPGRTTKKNGRKPRRSRKLQELNVDVFFLVTFLEKKTPRTSWSLLNLTCSFALQSIQESHLRDEFSKLLEQSTLTIAPPFFGRKFEEQMFKMMTIRTTYIIYHDLFLSVTITPYPSCKTFKPRGFKIRGTEVDVANLLGSHVDFFAAPKGVSRGRKMQRTQMTRGTMKNMRHFKKGVITNDVDIVGTVRNSALILHLR